MSASASMGYAAAFFLPISQLLTSNSMLQQPQTLTSHKILDIHSDTA